MPRGINPTSPPFACYCCCNTGTECDTHAFHSTCQRTISKCVLCIVPLCQTWPWSLHHVVLLVLVCAAFPVERRNFRLHFRSCKEWRASCSTIKSWISLTDTRSFRQNPSQIQALSCSICGHVRLAGNWGHRGKSLVTQCSGIPGQILLLEAQGRSRWQSVHEAALRPGEGRGGWYTYVCMRVEMI